MHNVVFGPVWNWCAHCFIVAGLIFSRVVFKETFCPFEDVQNIPRLLDCCGLTTLGLLGYLPLRFELPQLLNHQPPATKEGIFRYERMHWPSVFTCFCCWCWDFRFILRIWESTNAQRQWSSRTWEQLSTVDVCSEVVVSVGRGKRKTRLFGRHYFLLTAGWSLLLQVETELLLLSRKLESITSRLLLLLLSLPIRELHLQDVLALFWEGVDVLQAQPELTWRTTTIRLILRSSDADCKEFFQLLLLVLTVQAAEASLVALPKLVEVLGSIETFLDDGPSTFCGESRGKRLS